jgi:hypothetical protein
MGLSPNKWGKQAWHFIHMVALAYPIEPTEEEKEQYMQFFKSLGNILPCAICARHYTDKINQNPPNLTNREELFKWTVDIHNSVNKDNYKPELSYSQALVEIRKNASPTNEYIAHGLIFSAAVIYAITLASYIAVHKSNT